MEAEERTTWLVDDNVAEVKVYERLLQNAGLRNIQVRSPEESPNDYTALAADPRTGAFVIDHHLSERSGVSYSGLDVAELLRTVRPEMPVFILTNYSTESGLEENAGSVESVIPKENVRKHAHVYVSRILRTMDRYDDALTDRQRRIKELVDQKLSDGLNDEEEGELARLRADMERPFDLTLSDYEAERDAQIRRDEERLTELRRIADQLSQQVQRELGNG